MAENRPTQLTPQLVIGVMVIGIGVLFTLENLGLVRWDRSALRYWPAGLIAIGLAKLWQSRDGSGGAFGGFVFSIAGLWLLLEQTTLIRISFMDLWPLVLVLFGAYLVWQGVAGPHAGGVGESNATVSATAILGGIERGNNSRAFKGGDLTAIMGGCEIDLRHASIEGEAVFEVFVLWGGIEIRVPEDWTVVTRVVPVLGGFSDSTRPPQGAQSKRLVIRGLVIMAGVEVKN
jgi:predicted membrane protein